MVIIVFRILQQCGPKLCNFVNSGMLFNAVMITLSNSIFPIMQSVHYLRSRYDFVNTILYTLQSLSKAKGLTQYVHLKQGPKEILQTKDFLSEIVHFVFYHPKARRALYIWKKNAMNFK